VSCQLGIVEWVGFGIGAGHALHREQRWELSRAREFGRTMNPCLQTVRLAVDMARELVAVGHQPAPVDLVRTPRVTHPWPERTCLRQVTGAAGNCYQAGHQIHCSETTKSGLP
jgi:hypothetical protein